MKINEFLYNVFLFKDIPFDKVDEALLLTSPTLMEYSKKDEIYSPTNYERKLGFIIDGECKVERLRHDGIPVPLNVMKSGNSFGVVSLFTNEDEFPTRITATKDTKVLYFSKSDIEKLIRKYPDVAMNVVNFVSQKIIFLNKKVATFSEDSVENKLSSFLFEEYIKFGAEFPFNCKRTAETISVGRASLYRALATLTDEGIVKVENKKIYIKDSQSLERKTK